MSVCSQRVASYFKITGADLSTSCLLYEQLSLKITISTVVTCWRLHKLSTGEVICMLDFSG